MVVEGLMHKYILRRLALLVPIVIGVSMLVFGLIRFIPGDAVLASIGNQTDRQTVAQVRHQLGLDEPVPVQYGKWAFGSLHGDFGRSLINDRPVGQLIVERVPITLELSVLALFISVSIGLSLGLLSAVYQDTPIDHIFRVVNVIGLSVPNFWLGTLLILLPSIWFGWVPPFRYIGFTEDPWANVQQFVFPALALGYASSASIGRMTRSSVLEILRQDYIRTARAKGLKEWTIALRHVLKSAFIPVLTIIGLQAGYLLAGSVIMEQIYSLPGLGRLIVDSIFTRDYPVIQAVIVLMACVYVLVNLIVDLSYAWLDPRIRYS